MPKANRGLRPWRVGDSSLHLFAAPEVRLPNTDPDGRDRTVSCVAALHHCVVALAAVGWRAQVRRFPNPADPDHLAAIELFRAPTTEWAIALSAAVQQRRTDRRRYSDRPVPAATIAAVCARLSHLGVTAREVRSQPRLQRIVAQSVRQHAADSRLSDRSEHVEPTSCLPYRCSGIQYTARRSRSGGSRTSLRRQCLGCTG